MICLYGYQCYRKCTRQLDLQFCNKLPQKDTWFQQNWCTKDDAFDEGNVQGDKLITQTAHLLLLKLVSSYKVQWCCVGVQQP